MGQNQISEELKQGISMVSLLCSRFPVSSPYTLVGEILYICVHIVLPMGDIFQSLSPTE